MRFRVLGWEAGGGEAGGGGVHSDFSCVSMCVQSLWKPNLSEWSLG